MIYIRIIFFLFIINVCSYASNKDAQKLASYIANSHFHLDIDTVKKISTTFLNDNLLVKGFVIEEDNEITLIGYRKNSEIVYSQDFPDGYEKLKKNSSKIIYENSYVGDLTLFYVETLEQVVGDILSIEEKNYLKNKQQITMCVDPNWMPYEKIENGKYIGIGSDYIKLFEKRLNVKFKLIETKNWTESKIKARLRECEVLPLSNTSEKRRQFMHVTKPYFIQPLVLATTVERKFITNIEELKGRKIGITKGYSIIDKLKEKYPFLDIIETKNLENGLNKVKDGQLFGQIDAISTLNYYVQNEFSNNLKISSKLDEKYELGIASNKDNQILHNIFSKLIRTISKEEHNTIYNDWNKKARVIEKTDYTVFFQLLSLFILVLAFISFLNYKLKKLVSEKTKELKLLNDNLEQRVSLEVAKNRQNEISLMEQAKMAALGEMIGNIAHQWRQPLSAISSSASSMGIQNSLDSLDKETIDKYSKSINEKAQYLSRTIDDFRSFIEGSRSKKLFNLNDSVNSFLILVESSINRYNIDVKINISKDIEIRSLKNELNQCFLNFFNNSKDALVEKNIHPKLIFIDSKVEDKLLTIEFYDNAMGIDNKIIKKVFEPYFTTKHQSQGTGLGLNMTYRLIQEGMNGKIFVYNKTFVYKNKSYLGACFKIVLDIDN